MITINCVICKNDFKAYRKDAKYCSEECRSESRKEYYRNYTSMRSNKVQRLPEHLLKSKFPIDLKIVRGTIVVRKYERRAIKMVDGLGKETYFYEAKRGTGINRKIINSVAVNTWRDLEG